MKTCPYNFKHFLMVPTAGKQVNLTSEVLMVLPKAASD